jgi:ACS family D-galactonate transporter-like MFS transporter
LVRVSSAAPAFSGASKARLGVLALISIATLINYLDRAVMGVAAPSMTGELKISPEMMGLIFSAFSWTYAAAQIPGGILLDRFGTRVTYGVSLILWSVATLLQGLTTNVAMLFGFRLALGVAEAPCYPCNSRILGAWFPQDERARANAVYAVGQYAGLAFFSPVLFWIVGAHGWRALFLIAGAIGVVFGLTMYALYREPHQSRRANAAELDYISAGGGLSTVAPAAEPFSWANVRKLMAQRQIVGASIGQFCGNSTLVFFLTWFPTYLATERGMDWLKSGTFAVLPYIAASAGVLLGGYFSDRLLRRTGSANVARKLPIVAGLLLAATIVGANYVSSNAVVIAIMSVAFFGQGMVNLGWTLISDVAPRQLVGLTGGLFNLCANLAGIVTPIVVGLIVGQTGSFYGALAFIGVLALIGAASYVFVIGDVKRIELS